MLLVDEFASLFPIPFRFRLVASARSLSRPGLTRRSLSLSSICNSRLVLMTRGRENEQDTSRAFFVPPTRHRPSLAVDYSRFPSRLHAIALLSLSFHYLINVMGLFIRRFAGDPARNRDCDVATRNLARSAKLNQRRPSAVSNVHRILLPASLCNDKCRSRSRTEWKLSRAGKQERQRDEIVAEYTSVALPSSPTQKEIADIRSLMIFSGVEPGRRVRSDDDFTAECNVRSAIY